MPCCSCVIEDESLWWNLEGILRPSPPLYTNLLLSLRAAQKDKPVVYRLCVWSFFHFILMIFFSFSLLKMCLEFISAPFTVSRRGTLVLTRQGIQLSTHNDVGARGVTRNSCLPASLPLSLAHLSADPSTQRDLLLSRCLCFAASQPFLMPLSQFLLFFFVFLCSSLIFFHIFFLPVAQPLAGIGRIDRGL